MKQKTTIFKEQLSRKSQENNAAHIFSSISYSNSLLFVFLFLKLKVPFRICEVRNVISRIFKFQVSCQTVRGSYPLIIITQSCDGNYDNRKIKLMTLTDICKTDYANYGTNYENSISLISKSARYYS